MESLGFGGKKKGSAIPAERMQKARGEQTRAELDKEALREFSRVDGHRDDGRPERLGRK